MSKNYKKVNSINLSKGCTLTTNCITLQDGQTAKICVDNGKTKIMIENNVEEPKFKKGDVMFLEAQIDNKIYKHIAIVKNADKDSINFHVNLCINNNELTLPKRDAWFSNTNIKSIRYATEEEKRTLFIAMLNKGLFWDENKMKVRTLKDGDIITCESTYGNTWYSIFKEIKDKKFYSYSDLNSNGYLFHEDGPISYIDCILSIRYSTTEERQTFFEKIEQQEHKKWNTVTKEFENVEWIAKKGEEYWYVSSCFNVYKCIETKNSFDRGLASVKNKFRTKELAEHAAEQIKELLSKL